MKASPPRARFARHPWFSFAAASGREAAWLLVLALIPALLTGWLHPRRPDFALRATRVPEISLTAALALAPPALWVDARSGQAFARQHIPGAVALSEDQWEENLPGVVERWQPGTPVVVYCDHRACQSSQAVARRLRRELAIAEVYVLQGGWQSWQEGSR